MRSPDMKSVAVLEDAEKVFRAGLRSGRWVGEAKRLCWMLQGRQATARVVMSSALFSRERVWQLEAAFEIPRAL